MIEAERPLLANWPWTRDPVTRWRWPSLGGVLRAAFAIVGAGYNGHGVAMATAMGEVIARRLIGLADEDLPLPVTPLRPIPLHRLRAVGIAAMGAWYRLRDRV